MFFGDISKFKEENLISQNIYKYKFRDDEV